MDAEAIKEQDIPRLLADLKRLAEAATPGPWGEFCESGEWWVAQVGDDGMPGDPVISDSSVEMMQQETVDYICAANPAALLSLIAEIERLQGLLSATTPPAGGQDQEDA